jgi:hypothetical protein
MDDYWDSNWLIVTARMEASGARVESSGSFIRSTEILGFLNEIRVLYDELNGRAELSCLEPELGISMEGNGRGGVSVIVNLTPDHLTQRHKFEFGVDQTYLQPLIASCEAILEQYPVRGAENSD